MSKKMIKSIKRKFLKNFYNSKDFFLTAWWGVKTKFSVKFSGGEVGSKCYRKVYIFTSGVSLVYGGRTKSLLQRASILLKHANADVTICTTNFNLNYNRVYEALVQRGSVDSGVKFSNLYEFFMQDVKDGDSNNYKKIPSLNVSQFTSKEMGDGAFDYFDDQDRRICRFLYDAGSLCNILMFDLNSGGKTAYYYLDERERLIKKIEYNPLNGQAIKFILYDRQGFPFFMKIIKGYKGEGRKKIFILDRSGDVKISFRSDSEVVNYYAQRICRRYSFLISDDRRLDSVVDSVQKNCKVNYFIHSNHIGGSLKKSRILGIYEWMIKHYRDDHRIIVMTSAQEEDMKILLRQGSERQLHVLPHATAVADNFSVHDGVRKNVFVIISRLHVHKRINLSILAFAKALKIHNDIFLEIYGCGDEEQNLKDLVKTLNCEENIKFMGHVLDVGKVFSSSAASINTSKSEGFCLSILESLSFGCPVISFDVKYGPSDLIRHAENGYLVDNNSIEGLVDCIEMVYKENILMNRSQIKDSVSRFDLKNYLDNWVSLINS